MRDRFSRFLERRTAEITAYRFSRHNQIIEERRELWTMALELKGLKGKAIKAAGFIDRLNTAYDAFNEAAPLHAADVEGLTPQIEGLQEDLAFAAQVLGNSVAGSNAGATGEVKEKAGEKQVVTTAEVGKIDQAIVSESPAAASGRVALGAHPDVPEVAETASQTFPQGS